MLCEIEGASTWTQTDLDDHRRIASYISKRTQTPDPRAYHGRCYGTFGDLLYHMLNSRRRPIIAAAASQFVIDPGASARAELDTLDRYRIAAPVDNAGWHQIAARWLPDIIDLGQVP